MDSWEKSRIANRCQDLLDFRVKVVFDYEGIPATLSEMGKEFISPLLDPRQNDFTPANSFWLIAYDGDKPVMAGGVRLDDLRDVGMPVFWSRSLSRAFGEAPRQSGAPFPTDLLVGRVAYFGDLYSCGGAALSKRGKEQMRLFTGIGHFLTWLEFKPDVTYCFLQERDVMRGTHNNYGFFDACPFLYSFDEDPYPAGSPDWIATLPNAKTDQLMASLGRFTEVLARNTPACIPSDPHQSTA